jgi:Protein of unknown function (DUF2971)
MYFVRMAHSPKPDLFHYTSLSGVEGILRDRAVWASSLHFMNDSEEWSYSFGLAKERLLTRFDERPEKQWSIFISRLVETLDTHLGMNVCVFSLSEMQNQLSQWRAYCPREGGYSISFDVEYLTRQLNEQGFQLTKCEYDLRRQRRLIDRIISDSLSLAGTLPGKRSLDTLVSAVQQKLFLGLISVASALKHPDFMEEREWRAFKIVPLDDRNITYHLKNSLAIPHHVLKLDVIKEFFPIGGIMVGPNPHQRLAYRGVSLMAGRFGITKIGSSQTPYRNV